jgi:hypothetical protein
VTSSTEYKPVVMSPSMAPDPVYFEQSWAILSSICLINVLFGFMIVGITSFTPVSVVPIVVRRFLISRSTLRMSLYLVPFVLMLLKCSAAGAIANGLCYYAFYAHHPTNNTVVAAAVADVAWCVGSPSPV